MATDENLGPSFNRHDLWDHDDVAKATAPTIGTYGAGVTAAAAVSGSNFSDAHGLVKLTVGTGAAGAMFTVTFGTPLPAGTVPQVLASANAAAIVYATNASNTGFTLNTSAALATNDTVNWLVLY